MRRLAALRWPEPGSRYRRARLLPQEGKTMPKPSTARWESLPRRKPRAEHKHDRLCVTTSASGLQSLLVLLP